MPAPELVLCIDIGGDSLKAAEFSFPQGGGIILERFAFSEYGGDLKEEELLDALSSAMADIFANNGFEAKRVHISISGQSAFVRFVKLPPVGEEEDSHLGDFIEDKKVVSPLEAAVKANLHGQIDSVLQTLTPREEKVLRMRFGIGEVTISLYAEPRTSPR